MKVTERVKEAHKINTLGLSFTTTLLYMNKLLCLKSVSIVSHGFGTEFTELSYISYFV
jgi:hypothetical protein